MTTRRSRVRPVARQGAPRLLEKAGEFYESMREAVRAGRWNTAGLTAIHCAISACDAVLVYYTEQRSASTDHQEVVYLLASLEKVPDVKQKAETLRKILHQKHLVEYEDRPLTANEAAELAKLTERFYHWAQHLVSP